MPRSAASARSSSSGPRWWAASTWTPTGSPSSEQSGRLTAGLPFKFDGAVRAALFMTARAKPRLVDHVPPGQGRWRWPLRLEGDVGVGRGDHEVRRVEELGHRLVEPRRYDSTPAASSSENCSR